jgi:hypothetical protein
MEGAGDGIVPPVFMNACSPGSGLPGDFQDEELWTNKVSA